MTVCKLFALTLTAALLGTGAQLALAQPRPATLQAAGSEIAFTTKQMGVPVEGKFGSFSASIALDPKQPATGKVSFTIDTGSARFGSPELDAEVPKATWLNVPRFPQASFQSTAIKATAPGQFEVTGQLTIKGAVQTVVVPVKVTQAGTGPNTRSIATGNFSIKRLAFKVGENEWADTSMLADDVQIRFKLALTGLGAL